MPTYAYRCTDCGHEFDAFQRFADDPLRECPSCGGVIRRVIQPVGVVFKGTGWYINDSRAKPEEAKPKDAKATDGAEKPVKADTTEKTEKATGDKTPVAATKTAEPAAVGAGTKVPAKAAAD